MDNTSKKGSVVLQEGFSLRDALYFFTGRPLFLYRGNLKTLHCRLLHLFISNGRNSIPNAHICCSTDGKTDGVK